MQKKALGKGLSAILSDPGPSPAAPAPAREEIRQEKMTPLAPAPRGEVSLPEAVLRILEIPVEDLEPNPRQPRRIFNPEKMAELANSVAQEGIIQPILVTRREKGFEIVAGERRLRAARLAGLKKVPAIVAELEEQESLKLALVENLQRDDLSPLEEARAFEVMIRDFGWSHEELGSYLGRDRSTISNTLRLLQLPEEVQEMLESGALSAGHVRALIKLEREECLEIARMIDKGRLSVRQAERLAQSRKRRLAPQGDESPREDPVVRSIREKMESRLGLPVSIQYRGGRGKLMVSFGSDRELERIMQILGVSLDGGL